MPITKNLHTILSVSSLAADTISAYSSRLTLGSSVMLSVSAVVAYAASGVTQPCMVELYASTAIGELDTVPFKSFVVPIKMGATVMVTVDVPASIAAVFGRISNQDPTEGVTGLFLRAITTDVS